MCWVLPIHSLTSSVRAGPCLSPGFDSCIEEAQSVLWLLQVPSAATCLQMLLARTFVTVTAASHNLWERLDPAFLVVKSESRRVQGIEN